MDKGMQGTFQKITSLLNTGTRLGDEVRLAEEQSSQREFSEAQVRDEEDLQNEHLKNVLRDKDEEIANLTEKCKKLERKNERLKKKKEKAEKKHKEISALLKKTEDHNRELTGYTEDMRHQRNASDRVRDECADKLRKSQSDLARFEKRLRQRKKSMESVSKIAESMRDEKESQFYDKNLVIKAALLGLGEGVSLFIFASSIILLVYHLKSNSYVQLGTVGILIGFCLITLFTILLYKLHDRYQQKMECLRSQLECGVNIEESSDEERLPVFNESDSSKSMPYRKS